MKIYNPFKPHVVSINGLYALRRYEMFYGWQYHDQKPNFNDTWWSRKSHYFKDCIVESIDSVKWPDSADYGTRV